MDVEQLFNTALESGVILMENGAESYRVEDTVGRILSLCHPQSVDVASLLTTLYVTLTLEDGTRYSAVKRIRSHRVRLDRIQDINQISRFMEQGYVSPEEASLALAAIRADEHDVPWPARYVALAAAGFALMSGATLQESLVGGLAACMMLLSLRFVRGRISGSFIASFLHAFVITLTLGLVVRLFPSLRLEPMVIGGLISLFPGTTLTNGIRDILKADYLTGSGNLLSALVSGLALAVGTYFAMSLTGGHI